MDNSESARAERRARREERRARQRTANVGRAQRMHDARLEYERTQNENQRSSGTRASSALATAGVRRFFVGCSGWFYWHWRESFYPASIPSSRWFSHYASQFRTVELNAPFYSWPTVATVDTWLRQAARRRFI